MYKQAPLNLIFTCASATRHLDLRQISLFLCPLTFKIRHFLKSRPLKWREKAYLHHTQTCTEPRGSIWVRAEMKALSQEQTVTPTRILSRRSAQYVHVYNCIYASICVSVCVSECICAPVSSACVVGPRLDKCVSASFLSCCHVYSRLYAFMFPLRINLY